MLVVHAKHSNIVLYFLDVDKVKSLLSIAVQLISVSGGYQLTHAARGVPIYAKYLLILIVSTFGVLDCLTELLTVYSLADGHPPRY